MNRMNRMIVAALLCLVAAPVMAADYGTCILDTVPGVKNQQAFYAAVRLCTAKHPGGLSNLEYGSGKGWVFSKYNSPDECVVSESRDTHLVQAVSEIRNVCTVMYGDEPEHGPWEKYQNNNGTSPAKPGLFDDLIPKKR